MLDVIEDSRNEFKEILNDKLEKEVVSFLIAEYSPLSFRLGYGMKGEPISCRMVISPIKR